MADWFILRLPGEPDAPATWMVADSSGRTIVQPQRGALTQAASLAAGRRVCVLVPSTDVLLVEADVPVKAGAKVLQVVPYALEEQLAEDIEDLHFAVGRRDSVSGRTPVAVVSRSLMNEWFGTLRAAGISPEAMYADSDLLPANPGQSVALLDEDVAMVRPVGGMPLALPLDALAEALEVARGPGPQEMTAVSGACSLILYTGAEQWQRRSRQVEAMREGFENIQVQLLTDGPLAMLAQQIHTTGAINLLQGAYAPATSFAAGWKAWRVAAILLAALVVTHVGGRTAELVMLKRTERALDASIAETFRAAMPGELSAVDARRRMEQRLMATQGSDGATGLLAALHALAQARGSVPGTVVQALAFRDGALDLKIAAPSPESLERISQSLRAGGWQADLTAGNVAGSAYEGRIQIKPRRS